MVLGLGIKEASSQDRVDVEFVRVVEEPAGPLGVEKHRILGLIYCLRMMQEKVCQFLQCPNPKERLEVPGALGEP